MLAKSLISLCVVPLGAVVAGYLGRDNPFSSADLAEDGIQYRYPGQYPVHDKNPPHHPHHPREVNGTIYEFLSNNPKFTLITKALNFEEKIAALLNDSSANLTFFAPPDAVLRRKHGHHRSLHLQWFALDELWDGTVANPLSFLENADLGSALDLMDNVDHPHPPGDPEKRKKIIKYILHIILSYHIVDGEYDIQKLSAHNTVPSHLNFHHVFDHQPIRLRVERKLIPPSTWINYFARIFFGDLSATNGLVHIVSRPLIPPPSVFQELYMFPEYFSVLTSTLQRSNLTDLVDFRYVYHEGFKGTNLVTVFAPTNFAFEKLPHKLKLFLFSPFGERVLQKLLRYHIVPEVAFFSDYIHHGKVEEQPDLADLELSGEECENPSRRWFFNFDWPRRRKGPVIEPISREQYTLETALFNHTLDVVVDKKRVTLPVPSHCRPSVIKTNVIVNHQLAHTRDIVALNGAVHIVNRLLDPRKRCHHPHEREDHEEEHAWDEWEEWLPKWADEN